jgi:hypothetical protein
LQALKLLQPGLASREIVEGSVHFHFHRDCISTYNDQFAVMVPFATEVEGAVRAEELYKLLDKMTGDQVEITQEPEENEIKIKSGRTKAGLRLLEKVVPPLEPENEFYALPKDYQDGLSFCQFSCSRDMTRVGDGTEERPNLTCIHIQGNLISSSDNWRVTQFVQTEPWPYDFLLPGEQAEPLGKYEFTHMALDWAWVHFFNEESGLLVSIRLKSGKPMDVEKYLQVEGEVILLPDEIKESMERSIIMVEGASLLDLRVELTLKENQLICKSKKSVGWLEEIIPIDYSGPQIQMIANPKFLQEILSLTQEMVIGEISCLFRGLNFRHVMMLMA